MSSLRPRSSPNKKLSNSQEISIATEEENNKDYGSNLNGRRYVKVVGYVVLCLSVLAVVFYLGTISGKGKGNGNSSAATSSSKLELKVHWTDEPVTLLNDGNEDADACILLTQCFKSSYFAPDPVKYPQNPLQPCHVTLRKILQSFDSGFYFRGARLVGFISSEYKNTDAFGKVILYNVCVRADERGKGIAKSLIPEYVKAVVAKRISKRVPKVYVGLDVDFDTETAVSAFALYAKMGFNRWWEPCQHIAYFNFNRLEQQSSLANVSNDSNRTPTFLFPMSEMVLARQSALNRRLFDRNGWPYTHYCMIMLLGADDFGAIGQEIKDTIQSALLLKRQNESEE